MDPVLNPYAPGAGSPPPELAGRSAVRRDVEVCIERLRRGKPAKSVMMVGLRGVGKTVLLDHMRKDAEGSGVQTVRIEAPENRSLPALIAPQLRLALLRLSKNEAAKDYAIRGLRALAGFASKRARRNPMPSGCSTFPRSGHWAQPMRGKQLSSRRKTKGSSFSMKPSI